MADVAAVDADLSSHTPPNPRVPDVQHEDSVFDVSTRYIIQQVVGRGAFGYVMAAECNVTGKRVAIKKVKNATADRVGALRLLREISFLRHLRGHPNVICVQDVIVRQHNSQVDVYLVTELMEADLEQIIKSSQYLSNEHIQYLSFQMLAGLQHLHDQTIIHRDLKPSNLVVDSFCRLKICDLGLSRHICESANVPAGEDALFTDYVVTRWYRAPELLLGSRRYCCSVDIWAAGCILAELMVRRPVFTGNDPSDMLLRIAGAIRPPSASDMSSLEHQPGVSHGARLYLHSLPRRPLNQPELEELVGRQPDDPGLNLLLGLLRWNTSARLSVQSALAHPYLSSYHGQATLPPAPSPDLQLLPILIESESLAALQERIVGEAHWWSSHSKSTNL